MIGRIERILEESDLLWQRGRVIYSSLDTLEERRERESKIYFLGSNPSGDENSPSIREDLNRFRAYPSHNAYLNSNPHLPADEWRSKLQGHVWSLMKYLDLKLEDVCSSNIVFQITQNLKGTSTKDLFKMADLCWEVHELIIQGLKPKIILAYGNGKVSSYGYLRTKFNPTDEPQQWNSGYGPKKREWKFKSHNTIIAGQNILVVGIPHLSYYDPDGKYEAINTLKAKLMTVL